MPQRVELQAVEFCSLLGQLRFDGAGQREVHVVAAQQDVLADGNAVERQLAFALGDGDEREVRGAAADIDHQDQVARVDALAPVGMALDPGIERRLRLFEQDHVAVACLLGGRQGELARHGVEGGGHRHQHLLIGEGRVGHFEIPGVAKVLQIAARGFYGRELLHALGGAPGENRAGAIDAGLREPTLRRRDEAARVFDAAFLRQAADQVARLRVPGKRQRAFGEIQRAGQVERRGQQRFLAQLAGVYQLRDRRQRHGRQRKSVSRRAGIRVGERAVGGAQVDADYVAGFHYSISTSAGAMTCEFCLPCKAGSSTFVQRHPLWRRTPPGGGCGGTLPSSLTLAGSMEASRVNVPSTPSMTGASLT